MNYVFPKGLYTDVRIEHVFSTNVRYLKRDLKDCKEQKHSAAFVRVYDGEMWYYASTTDLAGIQGEINSLTAMAKANPNLANNEIYKRLNGHKDVVMTYVGNEVSNVTLDKKIALLEGVMPHLEKNEYTMLWA